MARSPHRSLVIPMLDESARIRESILRIAECLPLRVGLELILVDDGSTDGTAGLAEKALAEAGLDGRVVVQDHAGKGAAVATGTSLAAGDLIGFVDADLSTDVDDVVAVFDAVGMNGADVAIGSRAHPRSTLRRRQPRHREAAGQLFNWTLRRLGLTERLDTQCGLKAFTADAAATAIDPTQAVGFAFDAEVLLRAERAGLTVVEIPVEWRHQSGSSVKVLRDAPGVAVEVWRLRKLARAEVPAAT